MVKEEKNTINVLMNINNYYGEHRGRLGPILKFLGVSVLPVIVYVMLYGFLAFIPVQLFIVLEVIFVVEMALIILGRQEERLANYKKSLEGDYDTVDSILRLISVKSDGLLEFISGDLFYIISGYTKAFEDDGDFSEAMEEFLHQLEAFQYDIHLHLVYDEDRLQDNSDWMKVYTDENMMQERMAFYIEQDDYCLKNTKLYRYNFKVQVYKSKWKTQRKQLEAILAGKAATTLFDKCFICDKYQAECVAARDLGAYIDLSEMLKKKYENESYYGSRVLFYGDIIPEEYKPKVEVSDLEERRVLK